MNRKILHRKVPTAYVLAFVLGCVFVGVWSCEYPNLPGHGNTPPHTRLANVPADDTLKQYLSQGQIPEVTLFWAGDDEDGYVVAYTYRWSDLYGGHEYPHASQTVLNLVSIGPVVLPRVMIVKAARSLPSMYNFFATLTSDDEGLARTIADSLITGRPFAVPYKSGVVVGDSIAGADSVSNPTPTQGRFIFDSPDTTEHRFSIAATDNNGAIDPAPAVVNFWTLAPLPPVVAITAGDPVARTSEALLDTNQIAIRYATDRFLGLRFDYSGKDRSTDDIVYSWAVDSISDPSYWTPWGRSQRALVTARLFKPIVTGWHKFFVQAKNRWGAVSNIDSVRFKATILAIDDSGNVPRILVINSTIAGNGTLGSPDTNQMKGYYSQVLDSDGFAGRYDFWTVQGRTVNTGFPDLITIGRYSTVIILMERRLRPVGDAVYQLNTDRQNLIKRYLLAGGNLIFSGPVDLSSIVSASGWYQGNSQSLDPMAQPVVHASTVGQNNGRQFVGFKGRSEFGYPYVRVDSTKLPTDSLGSIRSIAIVYAFGFAEAIGWFDSDSLRPQGMHNPFFQDQQVGVRFLANEPTAPSRRTFSVVHFGFPLYFGETSAVIVAMRRALLDVHEIPSN